MFLSLFKFFTSSIVGATGIGVAMPFTYIASTQTKFKDLWKKTLNHVGLIISCRGHDAEYRVEMTTVGRDDKDLGLGVTFNLVKRETNHYGRNTTIKEEKRNSNRGGDKKWGFKGYWSSSVGESNKKEVGVWYDGRWGSGNQQQERITNCTGIEGKIERSGGDRIRRDQEVDAYTIQLEAVKCTGWFTKTCDIQINSSSGLKWSETFKPTITYSPF